MQKIWKIFEYGYLIIAVIFIVETVLMWKEDRQKAYVFLGFAVVAGILFFFRRKFRRRIENRNK